MLKHFIENDIYHITDENDEVVLTIKLENSYPGDQIEITKKDSVYSGPIKFLSIN